MMVEMTAPVQLIIIKSKLNVNEKYNNEKKEGNKT